MHGSWGKRYSDVQDNSSSDDKRSWKEFNGSWGKREAPEIETKSAIEKRSNNWSKLTGNTNRRYLFDCSFMMS